MTQGDLRERIKRRRIIWVELLNKDMKRKGWEKVMQGDLRERIKKERKVTAANNMGGVFK